MHVALDSLHRQAKMPEPIDPLLAALEDEGTALREVCLCEITGASIPLFRHMKYFIVSCAFSRPQVLYIL